MPSSWCSRNIKLMFRSVYDVDLGRFTNSPDFRTSPQLLQASTTTGPNTLTDNVAILTYWPFTVTFQCNSPLILHRTCWGNERWRENLLSRRCPVRISARPSAILTEVSQGALPSLQANSEIVPRLGYGRFFSNNFQFFIHPSSYPSTLHSLIY